MKTSLLATFLFCLVASAQQGTTRAPAGSIEGLTNKDILDMQSAGLSEQVILAKIRVSRGHFDTTPAALKRLKAAGVSESVILAIIDPSAPPTTESKQKLGRPPHDETLQSIHVETGQGSGLTPTQIADLATRSVVLIESYGDDGEKRGHGSGYVFSDDGVIVTNYHVIRGARGLVVRFGGKAIARTDTILGYDIDSDVAALQISGPPLTALPTADGAVNVGDRVFAMGAPLGLERSFSEGIVSAFRDNTRTHVIQTTASISPGSSGGPLLNDRGNVIGLTTAVMREGQNLNFAVGAKHVLELLARRQAVSLAEMLSETVVAVPIAANTIMVPARSAVPLNFPINAQQGAVLEGTYSISGGTGRDVGVILATADGKIIVNSGRVSGFGQIKQRLSQGRYTLVFDNRFSTMSAKSVSPDLRLTYYR